MNNEVATIAAQDPANKTRIDMYTGVFADGTQIRIAAKSPMRAAAGIQEQVCRVTSYIMDSEGNRW